jgi:hypothetical protein
MTGLDALMSDADRLLAGEREPGFLRRVALSLRLLAAEVQRQEKELAQLQRELGESERLRRLAESSLAYLRTGLEGIVERWGAMRRS